MPTRLPIPGQDATNWGTLLNNFIRSYVVNVQDHGADPTGAADSTSAFNTAINNAPTNGGIVYVPTGTYIINASIVMKSNIYLMGAGYNTILRKKASSGQFSIITSGGTTTSNAIIDNLRIDGNKASQSVTTSGQEGILFSGGSSNNLISNVRIENTVNDGINLTGDENSITACLFRTIGAGTANGVKGGITITGKKVQIYANQFHTTVDHGIKLNTGSHQAVITDNAFYDCKNSGINIQGSNFVSVLGNTLQSCSISGITLTGSCSACTVNGNAVTNSTGPGIIFSTGSRHTVVGNISADNSTYGILFSGVTSSVASGNYALRNASGQISGITFDTDNNWG